MTPIGTGDPMSDNTIAIYIRAYGKQAQAELGDLDRGLKRIHDTADRMGNRMMLAGGAMAAAFGLMGRGALSAAASMEQTRVAFGTLMHSASAAQALLRDLAKFAAETPFDLPQVQSASRKLLAYGFTAKQVIPILRTLGDASGSLGLDAGGLDRIIVAMGQIKAKAKLEMQDLRQLAESGIPVFDILAEKLNMSKAAVTDIGKAAIDSKRGFDALVAGMNERFGGGMEKQARTFLGIWRNITDQITQFMSNTDATGFGDRLLQGLKPALQGLLNDLNRLRTDGTLARWAKEAGDAFAGVAGQVRALMGWLGDHPELAMMAAKFAAAATAATLFLGVVNKIIAVFTAGWLIAAVRGVAALGANLITIIGMTDGIAGLGAAAGLAGEAILTALGPIGIAIAAVVAAVGALYLAWRTDFLGIRSHTRNFLDWWKQNTPGLERIWRNVTGSIRSTWQALCGGLKLMWQDMTADLGPMFQVAGKAIRAVWDHTLGPIITAIREAKATVSAFVESQTAAEMADRSEARLSRTIAKNARLKDQGLTQAQIAYYWNHGQDLAAAKAYVPGRADTTNGRSPGAVPHTGDSERAQWAKDDAPRLIAAVQDYYRTAGGRGSVTATNIGKGAHKRYQAVDFVASDWALLTEAMHAAGLRVSNEVGRGNHSRRATGDHLHGWVPSEGESAAVQAAETRAETRAKDLERGRDEARRLAEAARQAADQARMGILTGGIIPGMRDRFGLGSAGDAAGMRRRAALLSADQERGRAMQQAGADPNARALVTVEWLGKRQQAHAAYYAELAAMRQKDLDAERKAQEQAADAAAARMSAVIDYQKAALDDRIQAARSGGTLDKSDVAAVESYYNGLAAVRMLQGDLNGLLTVDVERRRALAGLADDLAEQERRVQIRRLETNLADLRYEATKMQNGPALVANLQAQFDLLDQIERIKDPTYQPGRAVQGDRSDQIREAGITREQQAAIDREKDIQEQRVRLAQQTNEQIAGGWADAMVSMLDGNKPGDAWRAFCQDMKRTFLGILADMLKAWAMFQLSKAGLARAFGIDAAAGAGGGPGQASPWDVLSGIFGVRGSGPRAALAGAPAAAGILPFPGGGSVPGIPGLPGGAGLPGGLDPQSMAALGPWLSAGAGFLMGQAIGGTGGGIGGGLGSYLGFGMGGPIGALAGGLLGSFIGKGIGGLFGGLFGKKKRRPKTGGYIGAHVGSGGSGGFAKALQAGLGIHEAGALARIGANAGIGPDGALDTLMGGRIDTAGAGGGPGGPIPAIGSGSTRNQTVNIHAPTYNYGGRDTSSLSRQIATDVSRGLRGT